MQVPVALFWGDLDWLATPSDMHTSILPRIKNLTAAVKCERFNHLDFVWGSRVANEVYAKVIKMINESESVPQKAAFHVRAARSAALSCRYTTSVTFPLILVLIILFWF